MLSQTARNALNMPYSIFLVIHFTKLTKLAKPTNAVADPGFPVGGRRPLTRTLFGENVCENERNGSCWGGGGAGGDPWIRQCNVHSSVSLRILNQDVLCKRYTRMSFTNKVYSKAFLQNTLEHTFLHKLLSGVQFVKYTLMYFNIRYI